MEYLNTCSGQSQKTSGKEAFWPAKATEEAFKGNQSSKGPLEVRNSQDGWEKGRERPGPRVQGEEKGWTSTPFAVAEKLSFCVFLDCLPAIQKSLLPGLLDPLCSLGVRS